MQEQASLTCYPRSMTKIASYNIMSGGFNSHSSETPSPERLPQLQDAIKEISADIVGLVDTFRWDELYSDEQLAALFSYKYAHNINLNDARLREIGHNNGIAILSNVEINGWQTISLGSRDALLAKCIIAGAEVTIIVAYLDDESEDVRLQQITALDPYLQANTPLILLGDLNTVAPGDVAATKRRLAPFYNQNPAIAQKLTPIIDDMQRGEVIMQLEMKGLQDAGAARAQPTIPSPLFPAPTDQPLLRLDYCLHTPGLVVDNFTVLRGQTFDAASDHYPIVFDLSQ